MRVRTFFAVILFVSTCLNGSALFTSRLASAQALDAKAAAQKKVREGQRLAGKGEHDKALALFKDAYEMHQEPGYLYNIGLEQQALGHDVEALSAFERFLRDVQKIPPEFVADANQRLRELRKRIGELEVHCNQEGAQVSVDDSAIGRTPLTEAVRVSAGSHRVAVQKDGFETFRSTIHVAGGSKQPIDASLRSTSVASPAKATTRSDPAPAASVATTSLATTSLATGQQPADRVESQPSDKGEPKERSFYGSASAGADFWLAGVRQTPDPAIALGLGLGYRVAGGSTGAELRLGVKGGVSFVSEPANTDVLFSALLNPMVVFHAVPNRVFVFAEFGVGALVLSGLAQNSVLLSADATNVSGALTALEVRPGLGAALVIGDGIALYLSPSLAWSPSPSYLFQASSIVRAEVASGLMVGF